MMDDSNVLGTNPLSVARRGEVEVEEEEIRERGRRKEGGWVKGRKRDMSLNFPSYIRPSQ